VCFTSYGEIIAWESGYPTYEVSRTIEQWWRSQGHHDIMIGDYNAAGGSHARSSRSGKTYSVMVFVKLCTPPSPSSSLAIQRLAGADRYATAAAISRARFGGGASTVFVATGAGFPDALAGAPAAAKARGPILLTARDVLPAATATELARLKPGKIVVLGGPGAVSNAVGNGLAKYAASVVRWAGPDRYATAAAISGNTFAPGVSVAYIATATTFPDALSGGAVAGKVGGPILLVETNAIPASTASELARLKPGRIVVLGGSAVVSDGVAQALRPYAVTGSVSRLAGSDRFSTSVQVSRSAYGTAGSDLAVVATGTNFPDGLAGGPVAALLPGPLLLVAPTSLPSSVAGELRRLDPDKVFVLGGTASVSDAVVTQIRAAVP
jgi:putative cell wall-binding protein